MPSVKVLEGRHVSHDGKDYFGGEVITEITEKQAQALVAAGVAVNGEQAGQPSEEEVAAAAAQAGQSSEGEQAGQSGQAQFR